MIADAWTSGFVLVSAVAMAAALEVAAFARRRRRRERRVFVPWSSLERLE